MVHLYDGKKKEAIVIAHEKNNNEMIDGALSLIDLSNVLSLMKISPVLSSH